MAIKELLKKSTKIFFQILVLPFYLFYLLVAAVAGKSRAFQEVSQLFSLLPGIVGIYARAALYNYCCTDTSTNISVGYLTVVSHPETHFGDSVYVGAQCNIGKCSIGKNCLIGSGVHLLSGKNQHDFSDPSIPIKDQGGSYTSIRIDEDCWIGNNATVMADLGRRTVVAAGSVVTRPTPGFCIVAGNPAKILKRLNKEKADEESDSVSAVSDS